MVGMTVASMVAAALLGVAPDPMGAAAAHPTVIPNRAVDVRLLEAEPSLPVSPKPDAVDPGREADAARASGEDGADVDAPAPETAGHGPARDGVAPPQEALPLGGVARGDGASEDGSARSGAWWGMSGIAQTIGSTVAVVGLIFGARWAVVRMSRTPAGAASVRSQLGAGGRAPSGLLFVLGRYPVSRGASLVLIQLDRRVLLLSQSGAGFQTLAEISEAEEVASIIAKARDEEGESISAKFSSLLRGFDRRHEESERAEAVRSVVRSRPDEDGDALDPVVAGSREDSPEAIRDRLAALRTLVS